MNYLVMECRQSYAVVLDEEGRFKNVANLRYQVGQTLTEIVEMQEPQSQATAVKKLGRRRAAGLTAMAACLALAATSLLYLERTPYASVYMQINPEVRVDVNRRDVVVNVEGLNEDGRQLLEGYSHQKKALDPVMDELVDRAIEMGYLSAGDQITLSLDGRDAEWVENTGGELRERLDAYLADKLSVTIQLERPGGIQPGSAQSGPSPPEAAQSPDPKPEPSQSAGPQPEPPKQAVIPVGPPAASGGTPSDSRYGDGGYGASGYQEAGDSGYGASGYQEAGDSGYGAPADPAAGDSGYSEPGALSAEDGGSLYGNGAGGPGYGQSDYGLPGDDAGDDTSGGFDDDPGDDDPGDDDSGDDDPGDGDSGDGDAGSGGSEDDD